MFAANKFHDYIFGKKVTVESDHKPLETIFKKKLMDVPKRLQRMRLQLQRYNLNVMYKPGKHLLIADALSRNYSMKQQEQSITDEELEVASIGQLEDIPATATYLEDVRAETARDDKLRLLKETS